MGVENFDEEKGMRQVGISYKTPHCGVKNMPRILTLVLSGT